MNQDDTFLRLKRKSLAELTAFWDSGEWKNWRQTAPGRLPFEDFLESHGWTYADWVAWEYDPL